MTLTLSRRNFTSYQGLSFRGLPELLQESELSSDAQNHAASSFVGAGIIAALSHSSASFKPSSASRVLAWCRVAEDSGAKKVVPTHPCCTYVAVQIFSNRASL